jgi:ribosomal protein S18 acetylase RimI-like enzyme
VTTLEWAALPADDATYAQVHALVATVAGLGGAVGWLEVPTEQQTRDWFDGVVRSGGRLVLAREPGAVLACGHWQRLDAAVLRHTAEVRKVMTAPRARGRGLARQVVSALVADAAAAGIEGLSLAARGNNHGALRLYADLGFVVTGRRPDWIAVGDERFDQVLLHRDLRPPGGPAGLVRHGGRGEGPGRT